MNCNYCNKLCKNKNSLSNHERLCKNNPNKQDSNFKYVKEPWNKGLTKEDPRVARYAQNISKSTKGKPSKTLWTDEMRKAKSEWRKKLHSENPESHPNRKLANNRKQMSYPEKIAFDFLTSHGIFFEHNKRIDKYYPDFIIDKIIIEIDGPRWHEKEKDLFRDNKLEQLGYTVIRISTKEHIENKLKEILALG